MAQAVSSGFSGAANWHSLGASVAQGIASGISANTGAISAAARAAAQTALNAAKAALAISSPSRVMRDEVGAMIPAGIALGMDEAMPQATRDMQKTLADGTKDLDTEIELTIMEDTGRTFIDAFDRIRRLIAEGRSGLRDSIDDMHNAKISDGAIRLANVSYGGLDPTISRKSSSDQAQERAGDTFVFHETGLLPEQVAKMVRAVKRDLELGFA